MMNPRTNYLIAALLLGALSGGELEAQTIQTPLPTVQAVGGVRYVVLDGATEVDGEVVCGVGCTVLSSHSQLHTALVAAQIRSDSVGMARTFHVKPNFGYRVVPGYTAWPAVPTPEPEPEPDPDPDPDPIPIPEPDPDPDPEPIPGGVVFQSNWSTALGTSDLAEGDGGRWSNFYCPSRQIMEVVPGAPLGWTATPNVLQITNAGSVHCRMIENTTAIPQNVDQYFVRLYIRVGNVGSGGPTFHSFNMSVMSPMGAIYWGIGEVDANGYRARFNISDRVGMTPFAYLSPTLAKNAWYRFEYRVHFYDPANPLRVRVYPHIYDMAGALVAGPEAFVGSEWQGLSVAAHYAAGGYGTVGNRDRARWIALGYEGTGGNEDIGGRWQYAALEVRTDRFPGPAVP